MSNKRVYTVAKEIGMASKDLMAILDQAKIPVKSHMSTITEDQQKQLFSFIRTAQDASSGNSPEPSKKKSERLKRPSRSNLPLRRKKQKLK